MGFFLDSEAKVDAIHGRMVADGLDVAAPKREHAYSFLCGRAGRLPGRGRRLIHAAGPFSEWLRAMRAALAGHAGMDVACGDCVGCCTSSYFIKVRAHETAALEHIGADNLRPVPGASNGSLLMGFDAHGSLLHVRERRMLYLPASPRDLPHLRLPRVHRGGHERRPRTSP